MKELKELRRKFKMIKSVKPKNKETAFAKGVALEVFSEAFVVIDKLEEENERLKRRFVMSDNMYSGGV